MTHLLKHSIFLPAALVALMATGQEPDPNFVEKMSLQESARFAKSASFKETAAAEETDLIYQRMEWSVDPSVKYISGVITSYFKVISAGIDKITFDLIDNMHVDSVIRGKAKLNFTHTGNLLTIQLKTMFLKNTIDSLSVYYQGQPMDSGFGSFVASKHSNVPIVWTLSEPYGAREWWPCKQTLNDKIDSVDIIVTTPNQYRAASNGLLVSDKTVNSKRISHWKHRYPIATYLVAIAVTNYSVYTDTLRFNNGLIMPVLNYVYPENLNNIRLQTPVSLEAIKLYSDLFGLYPFSKEKYGHAQFSWSGGMEHQTMTYVTNFGFELLVHELAHSWFGNCITLSTWHDIWLNEGFATYAAGLAYERLLGGKYWAQWKQNNLNNILSSPDGSVYVADTINVNRIFSGRLSYSKGGYLLHMLRWQLGDSVFFRALRNYFSDTQLKYKFASQQQWVSHLESVSGTSLREFFNDWYYGEGYPVYSVEFGNTSAKNLMIQLSHTTSNSSIPFYEMPVPVRAYSTGRKDSIDFRLNHQFNHQIFIVEVPFYVAEIVIDPDLWLIRKVDKVTKISDNDLNNSGICIFPNPSGGKWQMVAGHGENPEMIEIYDISGRLLLHEKLNGNSFSAPWLLPGIYVLKVTTNQRVFETKLVKQ